ncbi:MAG: DNA starvation/stationary phase protection protein [Xanthomonadales bacterium]|nr:DNA starvation/stationary phase protection protein [Xanthomonadales bacterium]
MSDQVIHNLSRLLADSYSLYLKTQNFHWNVTGPQFIALHNLFEEQYTELAAAVDEIAERIRALGARAPGSYSAFAELTSLEESPNDLPADQMIATLRDDNRALARTANAVLDAADENGDDVSVDLATQRQTVHEKSAWMLAALLQ